MIRGKIGTNGNIKNQVVRGKTGFWDAVPHLGLPKEVFFWRLRNIHRLILPALKIGIARLLGIRTYYGKLSIVVRRADGRVLNFGLASLKSVTDVGVAYIVDAFQNGVELENMKFHGYGTGSTAESAAQTALVTELTTQYVGDVRPTGTQAEGATANIYRTVGTFDPDETVASLREHAVFSANAAGVMLDRSLFAAISLDAAGDTLVTTYEITFPSGG